MSNISFDNPWLLFLLVPLIAAVTVPFCITVRKDNRNGHNIASLIIHIVFCVCFSLAVSGMKYERVVTETNVYVLADISYSAEHNLDDVQEKLEQVAGKLPRNSRMSVICFGRNYELISEMGGGVPDVRSATSVDRSATDIGAAIRYAGNLFDDDVIKRIIVITDGVETVASNNILRIVNSLQNDGVYIDAVYLDDNLSPSVREVQIDSAEATGSTYLNKEEEVRILVRVNGGVDGQGNDIERCDGYVSLYRDGTLQTRKTASLYKGLNVLSLPLATDSVGTFRYEVRVETVDDDADYSPHNNRWLFTQEVTDEKKVLFIGGSGRDAVAGRGVYGTENVTYITDIAKLPLSVEEMCVYDEIALCNFDVRTVPSWQMFLSSLDTLVNNYGKTLSTYGNTFIQEDDGSSEALAMLAKLLPVTIGNANQDTRLFAIVLDISTSMNFESRLNVAKGAAIRLLQSLNPTDMVMVVGFSGVIRPLLDPTYLTTVGVIVNTIEACEVENETNLSAALRYTHELMPKRFYDKRVIVISDGLDPVSDHNQAIEEAKIMSAEGVAVSALTVYAKADGKTLFRKLVNNEHAVSGVFYQDIEHESQVDVVIGDLRKDTQEILIEGGSYAVTVEKPNDSALKGVESIAPIGGFWYNSVKNNATAVLTTRYYRDKVTYFDVPLYVYGACGAGKVTSFLSDISSYWTDGWTSGSGGATFLRNIPEATLPAERINSPFILEVEGAGSSTTVNVITSQSLPDSTDFTVTLTDPKGVVSTQQLVFQGGNYSAVFATDAPGTYTVSIAYAHGDLHYGTQTEFSVSYYAEYDSFTSFNRAYLYRLLTENGRILELDEESVLENSDSEYTTYVFKFIMPLLLTCVILFVADIIIRQLKWKDVSSFFKGLFRRHSNEK
ncbi:MAG: VWA domain-containing protein [Clostridia bacterium]|nr:VWA domain-containing protein [Clostridia bacterium]